MADADGPYTAGNSRDARARHAGVRRGPGPRAPSRTTGGTLVITRPVSGQPWTTCMIRPPAITRWRCRSWMSVGRPALIAPRRTSARTVSQSWARSAKVATEGETLPDDSTVVLQHIYLAWRRGDQQIRPGGVRRTSQYRHGPLRCSPKAEAGRQGGRDPGSTAPTIVNDLSPFGEVAISVGPGGDSGSVPWTS